MKSQQTEKTRRIIMSFKTAVIMGFALAIGLGLMGCKGQQTVSGIPVHRRNAEGEKVGAPLTVFDKEAAKESLDRWKLTRIGNGESHYVRMIGKYGSEFTLKAVYELRKVSVEVDPDKITEADKLNGKEWSGSIRLCYAAIRSYAPMCIMKPLQGSSKLIPKDSAWSQWMTQDHLRLSSYGEMPSGPATILASRINGKWHEWQLNQENPQDFSWVGYDFEQVQPSDLPK